MPVIHFTRKVVDELPLGRKGQTLYWDDNLKGFGIRVGLTSKVYIAESQIRRRTVRVTLGRCDLLTLEAARKRALAALSQMADGVNPNAVKREASGKTITVREAFNAFFADKPSLSPTTTPNYRRSRDVYLQSWASTPIAEISRQMVLAKHKVISERNGGVTANNVMRHFRSVYNYTSAAVGELPPNPVSVLTQARAWTPEKRRRSMIPLHALRRWRRAVELESPVARDFLLVALFTGMRRSEIATLRWEHIDFIGATLTVPRTKNGDPLVLPLSKYLKALLERRREETATSPWVFPGRAASGHLEDLKSVVARVSANAGVTFTLHDLRRTFVTIAESLDIPAYALKRLLNHRGTGDVTGGYIIMNSERLRGPVEKISSHILEKCGALHSESDAAAGAIFTPAPQPPVPDFHRKASCRDHPRKSALRADGGRRQKARSN